MSEKRKIFWKTILTNVLSMLVAVLIYSIVCLIWHPFVVSGDSMYPTYKSGDIVQCETNTNAGPIERGEVVIIRKKMQPYLKRIVALPGDTVEIYNGDLYVNAKKITEYNYPRIEKSGILTAALSLKENEYFCLGDNINHSSDSREFGTITLKDIKYRVVKKIYEKK